MIKKTTKINPIDKSSKLKDFIVQSLEDNKAIDIVAINLHGKTDIADYMIITSGTSDRHVSSLGTNLAIKLKKDYNIETSIEGVASGNWVLLDAGDIIIHIFKPEIRKLYDLENMWLSQTVSK